MPDEQFAFEKFPRGRLQFRFSRRQLLSALSTEFRVVRKEQQGEDTYKLSGLGALPDEALADIIPVVAPGCRITARDGVVWGQPPAAAKPIQLFPLDSPALTTFNLFNGLTPVSEAAKSLAAVTGWELALSFAFVRGLFLSLVLAGVCAPKE